MKPDKTELLPAPEVASFVTQHMREKARVLVSVDGPQNNVIKLKPPICWTMDDAELYFLAGFEEAMTAWAQELRY